MLRVIVVCLALVGLYSLIGPDYFTALCAVAMANGFMEAIHYVVTEVDWVECHWIEEKDNASILHHEIGHMRGTDV